MKRLSLPGAVGVLEGACMLCLPGINTLLSLWRAGDTAKYLRGFSLVYSC